MIGCRGYSGEPHRPADRAPVASGREFGAVQASAPDSQRVPRQPRIIPDDLGLDLLRTTTSIVGHDDVVSHVGFSDIAPRRSGYFAANDSRAFAAPALDVDYYRRHLRWPSPLTLVPGVHRHRKDDDCIVTLPEVSKTRFDKIRADSASIEWNWYHLPLCNCQHWAELVVNGVDNRPDDCRRL